MSESSPHSATQPSNDAEGAESPFSRISNPRLRLHAILLLLLGLSWTFDAVVFRRVDAWYNGPVPVAGELHQLILSLAMFGQGLGMLMAVGLVLAFDRKRSNAALLAILVLSTAFASSFAKSMIGRERPLHSRGETILHGPGEGLWASRQQSFPSGHATTAFTMAVVLSRIYPHARLLFWLLALGVGLNRIVTVAHYPSDVVAGAWLGIALSDWLLARDALWAAAERTSAIADQLIAGAAAAALQVRFVASRWFNAAVASPLLLVAVSLTINLVGNAQTPLWDRDEPRFATASREMLERNDWIVPTFNGDLRPDKPILIYWLMILSYKAFGIGPFAAKFASGVAGTLAVLATYLLGRSMFDRKVGLVAAWVLMLSPMLVVEAKLATADALLLACTTASIALLWRIADGTGGFRTAIAFWVCLSLGGLAKGPVVLGIVGTLVVAYCLLQKQWAWLRRMRWGWGILIVGVIVAPWCIAVQKATDGQFLVQSLGRHVLQRSTEALENHRGFPGYYVLALILLMSPWGWAVPWAIQVHGKRMLTDRRLAFLLAWLVGPLVMFELVRTKLVHYYLPAYPAAALVLAAAWIGRFEGAAAGVTLIRPWMGRMLAIFGGILGSGTLVFGVVAFARPMFLAGAAAVVVLSGGMILGGIALIHERRRTAFRTVVACMAGAMFIVGVRFLPMLSQSRPIFEVAERLKKHRESNQPIGLWLYRDPSIVLTIGGPPIKVNDPLRLEPDFPEALEYAKTVGHFVCPMTEQQFNNMRNDAKLRLQVLDTVDRWDASALRHRRIHLVDVHPATAIASGEPIQNR